MEDTIPASSEDKKPSLDKEIILNYMKMAIQQGELAIENNEVAVGCVMVRFKDNKDLQGEVLAQAHNLTNKHGNATLHCEINCFKKILADRNQQSDEDGIFKETMLFVTCEPCIMCAYSLALMGIKEVYFGCYNERFGGNGTILPLNNGSFGASGYPSFGGYLETECSDILKKFYERGNLNLDEEKRHRKKKKPTDEEEQTNKL